jgi:hypothetical protein
MSIIRADNVAPSAGGTVKSLVRGVASAWANLNGTGTIALRDSLNVSSVVDNEVGDYSFNLTNFMAATNYTVSGAASIADGLSTVVNSRFGMARVGTTFQTGSVRCLSSFNSGSGGDNAIDSGVYMPTLHGDLA